MALVRGVNTKEDDHAKGQYLMQTGRREMPGQEYPHLGSLAAKYLASEQNPSAGLRSHSARRGRADRA